MYLSLRRRRPSTVGGGTVGSGLRQWPLAGGNVLALGLTSLFTDVSSEMVTAVLPLYLTFQLRLSAAGFGVVDGVAQAVTALTLVAGAVVADRSRRYKGVAATGYAASAACKVGLLAVGSAWLPTTGVLFLDRTAKGLRTPPRDSLIALSAPPGRLAAAFGVHRALDTVGAVLGPFAAFVMLGAAPGSYTSVFVVSICFAMVGLGILLVFVQEVRPGPDQISRDRVSSGSLGRIAAAPALRRILVAAALLNVVTISDAFIYLTQQHRSSFQSRFFPLLFVGTSVVYLLLAVPFGHLADRIGFRTVLLGGYVLLLAVYGTLLVADPGPMAIVLALAFLGAYYAATDGVLMALASSVIPAEHRATGLALAATAIAGSRLLSSLGFGILWGRIGPYATVVTFLVSLAVALPLAVRILGRATVASES